MRKFILIAAMVTASVAAAQAGDSRSLIITAPITPAAATTTPANTTPASLTTVGPNADQPARRPEPVSPDALRANNDAPTTDVPRQNDTPRQSDAQKPSDTPRQNDTPRYNVRPAPIEQPAQTSSPSANQDPPPVVARGDDQPPRQATPRTGREYHGRPRHQQARLTAGRIIAAMHRYGIYW
jgi:hypothetical protein